MDQKTWYNFFRVLIPVVLAYFSSELITRYIADKCRKETGGSKCEKGFLLDLTNRKIDEFRGYIDKIIIHLLLPSVFLFSLVFSNYEIAQLPTLLLLGLVLPLFVIFFSVPGYYLLPVKKRIGLFFLPFMPATFGGGNRGTLLILIFGAQLVAIAESSLGTDDLIAFFAVIDFGNFVFLIFVMEHLIKFLIKKELLDKDSISILPDGSASADNGSAAGAEKSCDNEAPVGSIQGDVSDFFRWLSPGTLAAILLVSALGKAGFFDPITKKLFFKEVLTGLHVYASANSALFVYAAFLSMFLMFKKRGGYKQEAGAMLKGVLFGLVTRALGLMFIFACLYAMNIRFNFFDPSEIGIVVICFFIFLILPPSSIFPAIADSIIERLKRNWTHDAESMEKGVSQLAQITLYSNYAYMGLVFAYLIVLMITRG